MVIRPMPDQIGPFQLLKLLGEGGMGAVYLARQTEPLRREVAVKLLRSPMASRAAHQRFEAEGQALARMSHPNVAQVYEAGVTADGIPYIAMEYVPGQPITAYCDQQRLSLPERLRLFIAACHGVQHAHQKGVLHRDIKPSNLLVMTDGGEAIVKVIDFGVAKALDQPLTDASLLTGDGVPGTPAYMSPEALNLVKEVRDLDTRTDVYALGVLLYELIVGVRPFGKAGSDLLSVISEMVQGEAPSLRSRYDGLDSHVQEAVASARNLSPAVLGRRLKGDLDWITQRALARDRERRYESTSALAADIERHLSNQPVQAGPPTIGYRAGRFVRRHRPGVVAVVLVLVALLLGLAGTTAGLIRARQAEAVARQESLTALRVSDFLTGMFQVNDPLRDREAGVAAGERVTAREILDRGTAKLKKELAGEPEIRAHLLRVAGTVYQNLGMYDRAEPLLQESLDLRLKRFGAQPEATAESLLAMGKLLMDRGHYEEAERSLRNAWAVRRQIYGARRLKTAEAMYFLAEALILQARYAEAESLGRKILPIQRSLAGKESLEVAQTLSVLARAALAEEDYEAAESLYRQALEIHRRLYGDDHPLVGALVTSLGLVYRTKGDYARAEHMFRQVLEADRRVLGRDHPWVAVDLRHLADMCRRMGRLDESESLLRESLAIRRRALGDGHPRTSQTLESLALVVKEKGDFETAEELFREVLLLKRSAFGDGSYEVSTALSNLALAIKELGKYEEAEKLYHEAIAIRRRELGPDSPKLATAMGNLGMLLKDKGDYRAAEVLLRETLAIERKALGETHPDVGIDLNNVALVLELRGANVEAEPMIREALAIFRKTLPPEHWRIANAESILGACLSRSGRHNEAERLMLAGYPVIEARTGERSSYTRDARCRLIALYERWGKPLEASRFSRKGSARAPEGG